MSQQRDGRAHRGPQAGPDPPTAALARMDHPPFLTAESIAATGRSGPVFAGICATARLGRLVAVTGDAGDGRTSLLLALSGRHRIDAGRLTVDGATRARDIRRRFTVAAAGGVIDFDDHHTVADCLTETTVVSGGAATAANLRAWLDRLGVGVDTRDTIGLLPRFDRLRFAIACAAAARTPAIVVDGADDGLNDAGGARIFETLRTVADAGQLVIAACTRHDPPADTVIELRGCRQNGAHP